MNRSGIFQLSTHTINSHVPYPFAVPPQWLLSLPPELLMRISSSSCRASRNIFNGTDDSVLFVAATVVVVPSGFLATESKVPIKSG